jgi:hypothetical protein
MSLRSRSVLAILALAAVLAAVRPLPAAADAWYRPRVELGVAPTWFDPLADFVRFEQIPGSGVPEERTMEYESATFTSVRLAFDLHPELEFGWTRSWASTPLRFEIDGQELETGDLNDGQPVVVPDFDLTIDLLTFRWWPARTRWNGVGPVVQLGAGRIAQDQQGEFGPDSQIRTFDWSDDDFALVAGAGLEGAWKRVKAGVGIDVVRWRFEAPEEDVNGNPTSETIPDEVALAWMVTGRLSFRF